MTHPMAASDETPRRRWEFFRRIPLPVWDFLVFAGIAAAAVHARWVLWDVVPTYLWSSDSMSYLGPALDFLQDGRFDAATRRGFTYPMLIAAVLKAGGNLNTLVFVQHGLGVASVLMSCAAVRLWFGRAALPAVALCGMALGYFDVIIYLEHLVRNEALIHFFMAAGILGFCAAVKSARLVPALVSGAGFALAQVTKGILGPLPLAAAAVLAWRRRDSWRGAAILAGAFLGVFLTAVAVPRILARAGAGGFVSAPYAGIQFYGRVAQWTVLDGGIYPELKSAIRPAVEAYREKARTKLDNNIVIKRLIVPRIEQYLREHSAAYPPVDRVCRELAFEAVRSNPGGMAAQAWSEGKQLILRTGYRKRMPSVGDIRDLVEEMESQPQPPAILDRDATVRRLRDHGSAENFARFHSQSARAWLFRLFPPMAAASVIAAALACFAGGASRALWIALAAFWFFSIVLFSTVGRPMNRYVVPLAPVMFLALAWPVAALCVRGPALASWAWTRSGRGGGTPTARPAAIPASSGAPPGSSSSSAGTPRSGTAGT